MLSARRLATISGGGTARICTSVSGRDGLREIVAEQVIVHRIIERHPSEFEALPLLRIALVLVFHGQGDGLAVDVLHRRHREGRRVRADADEIAKGMGASIWAASYSLFSVCRGSPPSPPS